MHWCADETRALQWAIGSLPFVGIYIRAMIMRWRARKAVKKCQPNAECV